MEWIEKGARRAAAGLNLVAAAALIAMLVHINLDVLGRYLFNAPLPMTIEIVSTYYMVEVVFLPLASVEWRDGHITVDVLARLFGGRAERILFAAVAVLSAAYFAALAWRSALTAIDKFRIGEFAMGTAVLVTWPTRFLVPLGCGLIALVLLLKAVRRRADD
jgi:TRAP-type C4-dicarboxylate transport system permease small subunit